MIKQSIYFTNTKYIKEKQQYVPVCCYHGDQGESCYMEVGGMYPANNPKKHKCYITCCMHL